jgi:hypothetical protein
MKTVTVKIPRKGIISGDAEVVIDASGFTGQGCKTVTEAFSSLGQEVETEDKAEMYMTDNGHEHLREGE